MHRQGIAIVGLACRYPGASTPRELWENVLAGRRFFRRIPRERLRLEDYLAPRDAQTCDSIYSSEAALIEDWVFDRLRFRVGQSTFDTADTAHWLALEVAAEALADAGLDTVSGDRERTGVIIGNTLTGEMSRSHLLRLRWPYVRRQMTAALEAEVLVDEKLAEVFNEERRRDFIARLETSYKEPFPEPTEDSLAGGLANTIAGRVANHFDLGGGGYTVDGACSSSLLAVTQAATALIAGDLDAALVGGVDLSLDPFELVGFARTGALAPGEMRVYDRRAAGFIPGEGCGFVVLMRQEEALARGLDIHAVLRGWGVSSDGSGGLTRPEVGGQRLALERAYRRAGFGIDSVMLHEGHGTGTPVGDAVELEALATARRAASRSGARPAATGRAAIGSIKANIGHTKAAAGLAGLLKATLAVRQQILPPATGCEEPRPELTSPDSPLRILERPELWPETAPLRASVSAMGFGGINTHVVLEGTTRLRRRTFVAAERPFLTAPQDGEVLLLQAASSAELASEVARLMALAPRLARAEVGDLAAALAARLDPTAPGPRAAVVAPNPARLGERLELLHRWLEEGDADGPPRLDEKAGVFLARVTEDDLRRGGPRVGLLFPGQGSPAHLDGGLWRRRFTAAQKLYESAAWPRDADGKATEIAQPAIVTAALAGLDALAELGVEAEAAVGHSLGELVALHWADACDRDTLLGLAAERGQAMAELGDATGAMASLGAGAEDVSELINEQNAIQGEVVITGYNGPRQTVIGGPEPAVDALVARAKAIGLDATRLAVSHAFHSPLVAAGAPRFAASLATAELRPPRRRVASTVSGGWLAEETDLRQLLERQITSPVRTTAALGAAAEEVDLFLEVGPGRVFTGLARGATDRPVIALDAGGPSLHGWLAAAGALFVLGGLDEPAALFRDRFLRPNAFEREPRFLVNPCEMAPADGADWTPAAVHGHDPAPPHGLIPATPHPVGSETGPRDPPSAGSDGEPLEVVRHLIAQRTELPSDAIAEEDRLLSDLHLSSIAVGELVGEAARRLGAMPPQSPTEYANVTVAELARTLDGLAEREAAEPAADTLPEGLESWVRAFVLEPVERPLPRSSREVTESTGERRPWQLFGEADHPLAEPLRKALASAVDERRLTAGGTLLLVKPDSDPAALDDLLAAARAAVKRPATQSPTAHSRRPPLVIVDDGGGGGAAAFARSLHLEAPDLPVAVVGLPPEADLAEATGWIVSEATAARGFSEAHYDLAGQRRVPLLRALPEAPGEEAPLVAGDTVLVSGGGKGIGAECALALARRWGVQLALLGRSRPEDDAELAANLERLAAQGVSFRYLRADLGDATAVRAAVEEATAELGPVRAILHSAGLNRPCLIDRLGREDFERTLAPKVDGLQHLLDAVDAEALRLVVGFGSIIARSGLVGEADYAFANALLRQRLEDLAEDHPACRTLCVEWSVWSGVGMGARLASLENLARQGITAITPEAGVAMLEELLTRPTPPAVVVCGRYGDLPTLEMERPEMPLRRFLERPRVFVPGVELVIDAELSSVADPYLADHVFEGERLFPAVFALEAMAQVYDVLCGEKRDGGSPPAFSDVRFERPVAVPEDETVTIRLAALVRRPGEVEVALRSDRTAFRIDHFRARLTAGGDPAGDDARRGGEIFASGGDLLPLAPEELYGRVLFQNGGFRRVRGYRSLSATECLAEVATEEREDWFGAFLPQALELGDPGARDASIHAVQACIPHATVLPVAVERLRVTAAGRRAGGERLVFARERSRRGHTLIYELEVRDAEGQLLEHWEGLELHRMGDPRTAPHLAPPLVGPYLERRVHDLLPGVELAVAVANSGAERRERGQRAVAALFGCGVEIHRRPDGKPEAIPGDAGPLESGVVKRAISIAHSGELALAVAGAGAVGCDVEAVTPRRPEAWNDLLGRRGELVEVLAGESGEDRNTLATRIWTVIESLKKAGRPADAPLVYRRSTTDGWMIFESGRSVALTTLLSFGEEHFAFAVLTEAMEVN